MATRPFTSRPGQLVGLLLFLHPLHLSAQSSVGAIQLSPTLSGEAEYQVEPIVLAGVRSSDGIAVPASRLPSTPAAGWLKRAASRELVRMSLSAGSADSALLRVQQPGQRNRSWIGRHPVLFGTLAGFGGGFLIGYLPGDDGVFDDFVASFNGLVLGGVGAGTGALVGGIVEAATR